MIQPFLFITLRSFKNRLIARLRRLREPRYLISAIAGVVYIWFVFLRRAIHQPARSPLNLPLTELGTDIISFFVLGILLIAWALPGHAGGLDFSEPEIQFLFPAPLTRRQLLLYKVFRMQPQILISVLVMAVIGLRQAKFVGLWIVFVSLAMYFMMVALARARLKLAHVGFLARLVVVLALAALIGWAVVNDVRHTGVRPIARALEGGKTAAAVEAVRSPFHRPVSSAILFVPRLFTRAVLPPSVPQLVAN